MQFAKFDEHKRVQLNLGEVKYGLSHSIAFDGHVLPSVGHVYKISTVYVNKIARPKYMISAMKVKLTIDTIADKYRELMTENGLIYIFVEQASEYIAIVGVLPNEPPTKDCMRNFADHSNRLMRDLRINIKSLLQL